MSKAKSLEALERAFNKACDTFKKSETQENLDKLEEAGLALHDARKSANPNGAPSISGDAVKEEVN